MTEALTTNSRSKPRFGRTGRLFVLELSGGRIHSMSPDGSDRKVIVTDCHLPDGIAVDVGAGHVYWTNMGSSPSTNDGSIERADLDGKNRRVIVPPGATFTPKQIQLDKENGKLYWCDREGMRVMRSNLDGSQIETLVETGRGDADRPKRTLFQSVIRRARQAGGLQPAAQIEKAPAPCGWTAGASLVNLSGEPNQVRVFGGASAYDRLLLGFRV
jgi:hypothetical protein